MMENTADDAITITLTSDTHWNYDEIAFHTLQARLGIVKLLLRRRLS